jgi:hypothetical protein
MSCPQNELGDLDWERLFREFEGYEPEAALLGMDCAGFVDSLLEPVPEFVEAFLHRRLAGGLDRSAAVRALYGFLLQKRYDERLNLLHFAFNIFDDDTGLPEEIVGQTPFPHEDGLPKFKHFRDATAKIRA